MRNALIKSGDYGELLDMVYLSKGGEISKRRIQAIQVGDVLLRAYCHLRKSKRIFTIDNVLALVPVIHKESMVI